MPQIDYIAKALKIKVKSVFDLDELYKLLYRWFETHGYDFQELEYRESIEATGKNLEIRWYAEKKMDDYIKFVIKPSFFVLGLEKVEVEREGEKEATNKGEVELRFDAYLMKDYEDKWKGPFIRFLRSCYDKFIIKSRIEGFEGQLHEELYTLMNEAKAFLNLHRF